MNVIIHYIKNNRTKQLSNIQFVEFDMPLKRFYYWEFDKGDKGKSISLKLVRDIKVNHVSDTNKELPLPPLEEWEFDEDAVDVPFSQGASSSGVACTKKKNQKHKQSKRLILNYTCSCFSYTSSVCMVHGTVG